MAHNRKRTRSELEFEAASEGHRLAGLELVSMSSAFVRRISVIEVRHEKDLQSRRFGPICHGQICEICNNYYTMCPGHSGHIELRYPVLHPEYKQQRCTKVLKVLCPWCQRLVVETDRKLWQAYQTKLDFHDASHITIKDRLAYMDQCCAKVYRCGNKSWPDVFIQMIERHHTAQKRHVEPLLSAANGNSTANQRFPNPFAAEHVRAMDAALFGNGCGGPLFNFKDYAMTLRPARKPLSGKNRVAIESWCPFLDPEYVTWNNHDLLHMLRHVSANTHRKLGYNPDTFRLRDMLFEVLFVPPKSFRPLGAFHSSSRVQPRDGLNELLKKICSRNRNLGRTLDTLQEHLAKLNDYRARLYEEQRQVWLQRLHEAYEARALDWNQVSEQLFAAYEEFLEQIRAFALTLFPANELAELRKDQDETLSEIVAVYLDADQLHKARTFPAMRVHPQSIKNFFTGKQTCLLRQIGSGRCNNTARLVFVTNSRLNYYTVEVPKYILSQMAVEMKVTKWTLPKLQSLVDRGPHAYPGVHYVISKHGQRRNFANVDYRKIRLRLGEYVGLKVQQDLTFFNRQPTLHPPGFQIFRIKQGKKPVIRCNAVHAAAYNFDCDGDELNLYLLADKKFDAGALYLCSPVHNFNSSHTGLPLWKPGHSEILSASYLLDWAHVYEYDRIQDLASEAYLSPWVTERSIAPAFYHKTADGWRSWFFGWQLLQQLLPPDLVYGNIPEGADSATWNQWCSTGSLLIRRSQIVSGTASRSLLDGSRHNLCEALAKDYHIEHVIAIQTDFGRILHRHYRDVGATIWVEDLFPNRDLNRDVDQMLDQGLAVLEANTPWEAYAWKEPPAAVEQDLIEAGHCLVGAVQDLILEDTRAQLRKGVIDQALFRMMECRSKGNPSNLVAIMKCQPMIMLDGRRFHNRDLYSAIEGSRNPESRGFARRGYAEGYKSRAIDHEDQKAFNNLVGMNTSTYKIGYKNRDLQKFLETLRIDLLGSVRSQNRYLILPLYGGDGCHPSYVYHISCGSLIWTEAQFANHHRFALLDDYHKVPSSVAHLLDEEYAQLCRVRRRIRRTRQRSGMFWQEKRWYCTIATPVHYERLVEQMVARMTNHGSCEPLTPIAIRVHVVTMWDFLFRIYRLRTPTLPGQSPEDWEGHKYFFWTTFSTASLYRRCVTSEALQWAFSEIVRRWQIALTQFGDAIGSTLAFAFTEPAQQTIFHQKRGFGGEAGISRLLALLLNDFQKLGPNMYLLARADAKDEDACRLQRRLQCTTLIELIDEWQLLWQPTDHSLPAELDQRLEDTAQDLRLPNEQSRWQDSDPWVVRIRLRKARCIELGISPAVILMRMRCVLDYFVKTRKENELHYFPFPFLRIFWTYDFEAAEDHLYEWMQGSQQQLFAVASEPWDNEWILRLRWATPCLYGFPKTAHTFKSPVDADSALRVLAVVNIEASVPNMQSLHETQLRSKNRGNALEASGTQSFTIPSECMALHEGHEVSRQQRQAVHSWWLETLQSIWIHGSPFVRQLQQAQKLLYRTDESEHGGSAAMRQYSVLICQATDTVLALNLRGHDPMLFSCNHFHEMESYCGVLSVETTLLEELIDFWDQNDIEVDPRHSSLMAAVMVWTGRLRKAHCQNCKDMKFLPRLTAAAFGDTANILRDMMLCGDEITAENTTTALLLDQPIPLGTGCTNASFDAQTLAEWLRQSPSVQRHNETLLETVGPEWSKFPIPRPRWSVAHPVDSDLSLCSVSTTSKHIVNFSLDDRRCSVGQKPQRLSAEMQGMFRKCFEYTQGKKTKRNKVTKRSAPKTVASLPKIKFRRVRYESTQQRIRFRTIRWTKGRNQQPLGKVS